MKRGTGIVLLVSLAAAGLAMAATVRNAPTVKAGGPPCGPACNGNCPYPALDTDKNGTLDAKEIAAARADRALSCVKCHDEKRFPKSVTKADANRDGTLSSAERDALCRSFTKEHQKKK